MVPARDYDNVRGFIEDQGHDQGLAEQVNMVTRLAADYDQRAITADARAEERIECMVRALVRVIRSELKKDEE